MNTVHEHGAGVLVDYVFYWVTVGRDFNDDVDFVGRVVAGCDSVKVHGNGVLMMVI